MFDGIDWGRADVWIAIAVLAVGLVYGIMNSGSATPSWMR